jgi:signal transduction histidine kinase/DNA-binding response OmpR family regulator/streptogramin lyase
MGCDGTGLAIYHPQTGLLEDNPYYSREVDLSKTKIYSIVEDQKGNYWLGLLQKGVYMQPASESGFQYMGYKLGAHNVIGTASVTSVLRSKNGYVWVGTDKDGLYCLTSDGKPVKHFKEHFPATILGMTEDHEGRVWTGSYKEGMGWIDVKSLTYHPYQLFDHGGGSVFDLEADGQGRLWVATMGQGLLRLDLKTGEQKAYTATEEATLDRKVNRIVNNYISQLSLSPDGKRIYVATTMGVCAMNIESENWLETFGGVNCLNYGVPVRVAREFGHSLRIGTNDGLFCYDLKQHGMHKHGIESGLGDNGICSIEQDKKGNLWIATDHGLCCVDTKTKQITNYYVDNGLQSNEFSDGASWTSPDGMMLFGGLGGVTWFNPDDIRKSEWRAEVKLVDFKVNGESVTPGTMSGFWQVSDTTVIASDRFVLSAGDNSFALQLSTLTFDNPEHIVYRYRINDEEWVRMQPGVNEITFSHMSPGTYHFCVVAQRNDVTTPERCFTVVIHAPWYNTPLAYAIYVLAVVGAIWYYLRLRRRKEQNRLRLQEHIHAEEMADAKLKFFMNISHEIRTPMTLIVTPLLSLIKQDDDSQRRSIYETMRRNAERILGLINQMMDLRKIDKGQMRMHMCETELISFVGDIYTLFAQQAKAKNIKFSYEHDTQMLPVWIDRAHFDKVVVNILSNAFKFTPAGGQIHLGVSHDDGHVKINIKDSGEGIPVDKLDKVFERFYQSPSNANDRKTGTGIGLDLTRSLVELHHGTIAVQNNSDGPGCEFTVTIPLGNAHLQADEMVTEEQDVSHNVNLLEEEMMMEPVADSELPKGNQHLRIVVAEDDAEIREYLKTELSADYEVVTCENGRVALAEIHKQQPHLVISDVMMPEMDGNTLCSKIKSNATTSHLPVILLTAKNRDEDMLEGLETGADAYIVKPFNMDILKRTVANLIHNRQQLQLKYGRNDRLEEQVDDVVMQSPDDKLLARVMKAINENLTNSDLSVDLIAQEVGISRVHLHRKMKELTGQTPHDFIRNLRLKQAAHLLASGNMNVTEVVYACGFGNVPSFSTTFKKYYGMTPREYMMEHNSTHSAN